MLGFSEDPLGFSVTLMGLFGVCSMSSGYVRAVSFKDPNELDKVRYLAERAREARIDSGGPIMIRAARRHVDVMSIHLSSRVQHSLLCCCTRLIRIFE